jgi:LysR family transcriptional regulator for bpeEF and oprC
MNRIEAIQLFLRVAETRSFSKAAKISGLSQPTVSKQIAALESHLGLRLLRRTSRSFSLTQEGEDYYESARRILSELENLDSRISTNQTSARGTIRVAISSGISHKCVVPRLPGFYSQYPHLAIEFVISQRDINLVEEGIDVGIRIGHYSNTGLNALRVGNIKVITMASPSYLLRYGTPITPSELSNHHCIPYISRGVPRPWEFNMSTGPFSFTPSGYFGSNDGESIRAGVIANLGICHNSSWLFTNELANGEITQVLNEFAPDPYPLYVIWPGTREPTAKVGAFIEFLTKICNEHPHLSIT